MKPIYAYDRFRTGLVSLGVAAFLGALIIAASALHIGARTYSVDLGHTAGLKVGEPVKVAGVDVGKVTSIEIKGDVVRLDFSVDDDIRLGDDTRVAVEVATLLGTHYLAVTPRGPGDIGTRTIPISRTRVPFNLQDVIEQGTAETGELDVVQIDKAFGEIAKVLERSGDDIDPALLQVSRMSRLLAVQGDDIGRLLEASSAATTKLTKSSGDILRLMRVSDLIFDTLNARRVAIGALLADLASLGRQLDGVLQDAKADIGPVLRDLNRAIDMLRAHERSLGRAAGDLALAGRYVANAAGVGPFIGIHAAGVVPDNLACGRGILC